MQAPLSVYLLIDKKNKQSRNPSIVYSPNIQPYPQRKI